MKDELDFSGIAGVNKLIHEPARVSIMTLLSVIEEADFIFVMNRTGLTQGNLSSHLARLEKAGLVNIEKTFKGKRPHTLLRLSKKGEKELTAYMTSMKTFINRF